MFSGVWVVHTGEGTLICAYPTHAPDLAAALALHRDDDCVYVEFVKFGEVLP